MECTINGVTYVSIDSPVNDYKQYSCKECDIYKARPPKTMLQQPLCCDEVNIKVNKSCCNQQRRGSKQISIGTRR